MANPLVQEAPAKEEETFVAERNPQAIKFTNNLVRACYQMPTCLLSAPALVSANCDLPPHTPAGRYAPVLPARVAICAVNRPLL